jgi:hydrogenase nickel incorporation protein HypB
MCEDCGCGEGNARAYFEAHEHSHDHGHDHVHTRVAADAGGEIHIHVHIDTGGGRGEHAHAHAHAHEHAHAHAHDEPSEARRARTSVMETGVLAKNDAIAARNREWLAARGVAAVNLISSPGSGKTLLLERTLDALRGRVQAAVIAGDQHTDIDARRLAGKGAPVVQIETRASCHLDAQQVSERLGSVVTAGVRLLFIENVGNLVCPAAFDLGERSKVALLSVTEGEDKPLKYPVLFNGAPVCVITKVDLLPHLETDIEECRRSVRAVRPDARIFEVSARTGEGMGAWIEYLVGLADGGA